MSDNNQQTLPGTQSMETKIVGQKMIDVLFETGIQIGLTKTLKELKDAKAQHPAARHCQRPNQDHANRSRGSRQGRPPD